MNIRYFTGLIIGLANCLILSAGDSVEIVRDKWGIAHVFAEDEAAMFYGAGYAMAEDRLLQMMLVRNESEGRLSELLGSGEKDRFVNSDKQFRLLGFDRRARELVKTLEPDTKRNLDSFSAGLNAYMQANPDRLKLIGDLFTQPPRPWEAADSLAIWARYAYQFTSGWEHEVQARRQFERWRDAGKPNDVFPPARLIRDDTAAIITEAEFQRTQPELYQRLKNIQPTAAPNLSWLGFPTEGFKASHNWVVSGDRSVTGKPILESNPQIPVSFPTTMYEIHLSGGRYDVRGLVFPGTPAIFIGWNRHTAWGATALAGDHADLFEERLDPQQPERYMWKEESLPFDQQLETIHIKGKEPIHLQVRRTIHGPIVNEILKEAKEGELFALKHVLLCSPRSSLEAMMTMMRAENWDAFYQGMRHYAGPACNMIFADDSGNIAYQAAVSTAKRFGLEPLPRIGWTGDQEWEYVPYEEMPSLLNPLSQTIFSANHLPIGSWYPYMVSTSRGEGPRSWRLRELLAGSEKLSADDFHHRIHLDATCPAVRDFVTLATQVMREDHPNDPQLQSAVKTLSEWDGALLTSSEAYPLARAVLDVLLDETSGTHSFFAQFGGEWGNYGGNWNGVNRLIKDLMEEHRATGNSPAAPEARRWLVESFTRAVQAVSERPEYQPPIRHTMPYQNNLGQWGSLAAEHDFVSPPLPSPVTQTLWSQAGETYVQIVDLSDVDSSRSLLPPGLSEIPQSSHAADQVPLWVAGELHAAPLSRSAVMKVAESSCRLSLQPYSVSKLQEPVDAR